MQQMTSLTTPITCAISKSTISPQVARGPAHIAGTRGRLGAPRGMPWPAWAAASTGGGTAGTSLSGKVRVSHAALQLIQARKDLLKDCGFFGGYLSDRTFPGGLARTQLLSPQDIPGAVNGSSE